jgi:microcompartment protein CcmK/EutM
MATVNLGRIKFVWQGAYSGATAYVADDVVSYNGSSYICILASTNNLPTNTTYWSIMSSAGTNGTDLTSTLTTQGDIVYRNASSLVRLGAGTNGQVLTTAGASANPSWTTPSAGAILQVAQSLDGSTYEISTVSAQGAVAGAVVSGLTTTLTPSSASSKILLMASVHFVGHTDYMQYANFTYQIGAGTEYAITSSVANGITMRFDEESDSATAINGSKALNVLFAPSTTSQITFRVRVAKSNAASRNIYINRTQNNNSTSSDGGYTLSSFTVMELAGSSSSVTNTSVNTTNS